MKKLSECYHTTGFAMVDCPILQKIMDGLDENPYDRNLIRKLIEICLTWMVASERKGVMEWAAKHPTIIEQIRLN